MKIWMLFILLIIVSQWLTGCSTRSPTIAHTHIGHAMTGWHDTPEQAGLFTVAKKKAKEAFESAESAAQHNKSIEDIKADTEKIIAATDPQRTISTAGISQPPYGLRQALTGSVDHISFAASSDDASHNVQEFAVLFAKNAQGIIERCDLIITLSDDILRSSSREEVVILAKEVQLLAKANLQGLDVNGNKSVGDSVDEFGLRQLEIELLAMIAREDPPYTTVDTWYLFNLIRLPSGKWSFRAPVRDDHGYSSGFRSGY